MRRLSIRARLTIFSVVIIFVVLSFTGVALVSLGARTLDQQNMNEIDQSMQRAQAAFYSAHYSPTRRLILPLQNDVVVQIVNLAQNKVWAATQPIANAPVLVHAKADVTSTNGLLLRLLTSPATTALRSQLSDLQGQVITTPRGEAFEFGFLYGDVAAHSTNVLEAGVLISFPLLLLVAGVVMWIGIGSALAPVEAIRRQVDSIAAQDLSLRVPVERGEDEISRLATTLNEMLARLELASRFQQQFVSNASHELRSPLTTLLATVDLAASDVDAANWSEVADTIQREGRRLNDLIDNLFWLARSDEQRFEMSREEVDVDDLLLEEAHRLRAISTLHVDTTGVQATRVWGDPAMLKRLVRNVVDNASRYATSTLVFSSTYEGPVVELRIHDDGVGVDVATSGQFFERFYRADPSRSRHSGGSGLGLAIVAEIAARHGGSARFIEVERGSTMQIRLRRY